VVTGLLLRDDGVLELDLRVTLGDTTIMR